jgi:hypothetical protein
MINRRRSAKQAGSAATSGSDAASLTSDHAEMSMTGQVPASSLAGQPVLAIFGREVSPAPDATVASTGVRRTTATYHVTQRC